MSKLDDINARRDAAMALLTAKLEAANDLKINGAAGMDPVIDALAQQRADVAAQAYAGALDDPTTTRALAALTAAAKKMKSTAAVMVSATDFITNVNKLGTAVASLVSALKGVV
jgi:phage terminase Nu1 subunit (DNA packaging protein)